MSYEASTFMYVIIVSIFAIGGMCGALVSGWFANMIGRKCSLLLNNVIGILAALIMASSMYFDFYEILIVGRFLIGVHCGELEDKYRT